MLEVRDLYFGYGKKGILKGIDLTVRAGQMISLVGRNGSGKSTLIRCLNRILLPDRGRIEIRERSIRDYSRRQLAREIAYVPQHTHLSAGTTVIETVQLGRAPHIGYRLRRKDLDIVMEALERLSLQEMAFRPLGELSGGERQRVLIARALAQRTELILLDEPTSALDLKNQLDIMNLLQRIVAEGKMAALVAIHDLGLAARYSDRIVMLNDGHVFAEGEWTATITPDNLKAVYGIEPHVGSVEEVPFVVPLRTVKHGAATEV